MSYPVISRSDARSFLVASAAGAQSTPEPSIRWVQEGTDEDWESLASGVVAALFALTKTVTEKDKEIGGSAFEIAAAPIVHRSLPSHPALGDPEFWMWLAIIHGTEVVEWRYGEKADRKNYGVGGAGENFFYRLWLRAEIAYDPDNADEYELAKFGDIDFWRSHLFRQGYADARTFARALLKYQFPAEQERKPRLKTLEIRDLAKRLKRARTNLMFEIMTEARAQKFIEKEWAMLAAPPS